MNSELEAYLATVRDTSVPPQQESEQQRQARADFPGRFLATVASSLKSVFDSAAATLHKHGFGATVELVREQAGADPNSFPYIILHFSPRPCPPSDLGYIYTLAGASLSFICRRSDLCVEAVVAHPAGCGVERRVNFYTLRLEDLTPERVTRIVTDAVKQIIRR
ncbi:MAG: hypothetical protein ACLQU3_28615 [Limisphaerales bacterium]